MDDDNAPCFPPAEPDRLYESDGCNWGWTPATCHTAPRSESVLTRLDKVPVTHRSDQESTEPRRAGRIPRHWSVKREYKVGRQGEVRVVKILNPESEAGAEKWGPMEPISERERASELPRMRRKRREVVEEAKGCPEVVFPSVMNHRRLTVTGPFLPPMFIH
ncbi:hypothetical protein SAY86_013258 [Trapa natans]|uniref:Uncharacterized protein n=1 Tax=Trapa natans TaxID=22666 RepID=A0AAN7LZ82_TRANT|nr:hypothetical protein SAY86_013258 [Trapa natans]